jgi:hypothetical protein
MQKKSLGYILRAIVMLFLRAKVIPVNLQIHANVMRPLCVLNFIFEPLFVHVPDIVSSRYTLVNKNMLINCKCRTDR